MLFKRKESWNIEGKKREKKPMKIDVVRLKTQIYNRLRTKMLFIHRRFGQKIHIHIAFFPFTQILKPHVTEGIHPSTKFEKRSTGNRSTVCHRPGNRLRIPPLELLLHRFISPAQVAFSYVMPTAFMMNITSHGKWSDEDVARSSYHLYPKHLVQQAICFLV